jgi:dTDP-4-amino-4,6-dideoxygalactose transaminase
VTLGPDWASLARALDERPAAVVVAHLYGLPVDMPRVLEMTEGAGVTVIEDAAQGSGATLHRRPLGSFGQLAVLSFGRGKGVTGGRGGALLVNPGWRGGSDESSLLPGIRGVREVPALKAQWLLARPWLYRIPASLPFLGLGDTVYRPPGPLHRISAVSAAVAERSWKEREAEIARRQRNAEALLAESKPGAIAPIPGARPGWLRLPVVARMDSEPDESLGVMRSYPVPLPALPELNRTTRPVSDFPGALVLAGRLRTLPTHGLVSASVRARLGAEVRAAFSA